MTTPAHTEPHMQIILRINTDTNLGDIAARAYVLPDPDTNSTARIRGADAIAAANAAVLARGRQALAALGVAQGDGLGGLPIGTILIVPPLTGPDLAFSDASLGNRQFADGELHETMGVLQRALVDVAAAFQDDVRSESDAIIHTALVFNAANPGPLGKAPIDPAVASPNGVAPPQGVPAPPPLQSYETQNTNRETIRAPLVTAIDRQAVLARRVRLTNRINEFNNRMAALQADLNALLNRFTP